MYLEWYWLVLIALIVIGMFISLVDKQKLVEYYYTQCSQYGANYSKFKEFYETEFEENLELNRKVMELEVELENKVFHLTNELEIRTEELNSVIRGKDEELEELRSELYEANDKIGDLELEIEGEKRARSSYLVRSISRR